MWQLAKLGQLVPHCFVANCRCRAEGMQCTLAPTHSTKPARCGQKPGTEGHQRMIPKHAQVHAHMLCSPDTHFTCDHTADMHGRQVDCCSQPVKKNGVENHATALSRYTTTSQSMWQRPSGAPGMWGFCSSRCTGKQVRQCSTVQHAPGFDALLGIASCKCPAGTLACTSSWVPCKAQGKGKRHCWQQRTQLLSWQATVVGLCSPQRHVSPHTPTRSNSATVQCMASPAWMTPRPELDLSAASAHQTHHVLPCSASSRAVVSCPYIAPQTRSQGFRHHAMM